MLNQQTMADRYLQLADEDSMSMSMPAAPLEQHSLGMVSSLLDEEEGEDRAGGALALQSNKPEIVSNSNEFVNANDPCKSNDGADYTALTQSMFGEDATLDLKMTYNHGPCIVQKDDDDEEEGATANGEEGTDGAASSGGGTTEGGEGSNTPTDGTNTESGGTLSSPLDGDDTTTEGSDNGEEGGKGSDSTGVTGDGGTGESDGSEGAKDEPQSFYSCSPNSSSANTPPSNSKEVTLTYDYELHTSSPLNDNILSKLEDSITNDIANKYGLVTCSSIQEERRHLRASSSQKQQRSLQAGDVLAVGSNPEDESLSDQCKLCIPSMSSYIICVHTSSISIHS